MRSGVPAWLAVPVGRGRAAGSAAEERKGWPAQRLEPLPDRSPPALWRFRILAEAEHVAAGIEQGLDLERELRWIAGHELVQLDGGGDQLLEPL